MTSPSISLNRQHRAQSHICSVQRYDQFLLVMQAKHHNLPRKVILALAHRVLVMGTMSQRTCLDLGLKVPIKSQSCELDSDRLVPRS